MILITATIIKFHNHNGQTWLCALISSNINRLYILIVYLISVSVDTIILRSRVELCIHELPERGWMLKWIEENLHELYSVLFINNIMHNFT